jgi:hypothetical protein
VLARLAELRLPVELHRIGVQHANRRDAGRDLLERSRDAPVDLHREHLCTDGCQCDRERSETGADLDHEIAGADARVGRDRSGEVGVDQEVLAE